MVKQPVKYARVSTASGEQLSALENQTAWLKQQEGSLLLTDVESGLNTERPSYVELKRLIKGNAVSEVIATHFSRLGRDGKEVIGFIELCDKFQVTCRTRDDGILSCSTPAQKTMIYVKAGMAESESDVVRNRVLQGRASGKKEHKPMKKPCWGYKLSEDRKRLELHPEHAQVASKFIARLKKNQWRMMPTLREFDGKTPLSSVRAVRSWLLNPTIRGALAYGQKPNHSFEEIYWDKHPALLSHEDFSAMEAVLAVNRRQWGKHSTRRLRALTGLCRCEECGNVLSYIPDRAHAGLRCKGDMCPQHYKSVREDALIAWVIEQLQTKAAEKLAAKVEQDESPEIGLLREQIQKLEAFDDPDLQEGIEIKKARLRALQNVPIVDDTLVDRFVDPSYWMEATYEQLTEVFHQAIACILITKQAPTEVTLRL